MPRSWGTKSASAAGGPIGPAAAPAARHRSRTERTAPVSANAAAVGSGSASFAAATFLPPNLTCGRNHRSAYCLPVFRVTDVSTASAVPGKVVGSGDTAVTSSDTHGPCL